MSEDESKTTEENKEQIKKSTHERTGFDVCASCYKRFDLIISNWTDSPSEELIQNDYDLVIGSDVIYKGSNYIQLAHFLYQLSKIGLLVLLLSFLF